MVGPNLELLVVFDDPKALLVAPKLDTEPNVFAGCEPRAPNKLELVAAGLGAVALPKTSLLCGPDAFDDDGGPPATPKLNNPLFA